MAGFINPAHDRLSYNPNLEWLVDFPLRDAMAEALGMETTLEVDSNASCLGEYRFGAGRGSQRFLCLVSGTGLGVGMVIDGALVRFMGECIGDAGPRGGGRRTVPSVPAAAADARKQWSPSAPLFKMHKAARRFEK